MSEFPKGEELLAMQERWIRFGALDFPELQRRPNTFGVSVDYWRDIHDATEPGDIWRSFRAGDDHMALKITIPIPRRLGVLWHNLRQWRIARRSHAIAESRGLGRS